MPLLRRPASNSGLYLKLVARVYLIEKARFPWYCLYKFLGIQVAKRPLVVSFRKRQPIAVQHAKARNVWIRVWREIICYFVRSRATAGFNSSQVRASHGPKGLGLIAIEER